MNEYARYVRRRLHEYPEIGFELPKTIAFIKEELDKMGVSYSEEFGKSSIVATINEGKGFTIGVRADMDALPMSEENDVPYKSKIEGAMHACGHDAHTAVALALVKEINDEKDKINCSVKFIFQPAEETSGGALSMVEKGVMEKIDCIVGLHCLPSLEAGRINLFPYELNAFSDGFEIDFCGKSAHAANQQDGVDAIMMAVKAYTAIEFMVAKEIRATHPCIFNVGKINAGETNNIIADKCHMYCTLRTWYEEDREKALSRIQAIVKSVADESGGKGEFKMVKRYPVVYNNKIMTEKMYEAAVKAIGAENIDTAAVRGMGGEDFSYFSKEKPGCFFRIGVRNEARGITAGVHQVNFDIDEEALDVGVRVFKSFIYENMNGIKFE